MLDKTLVDNEPYYSARVFQPMGQRLMVYDTSVTADLMDRLRKEIIQGGMGAGVSDYHLARAVSELGQLGVVSGTGPITMLVRRLQKGDLSENVRSALAEFPNSIIAKKIVDRYFVEGGIKSDQRYIRHPFPSFEQVPGQDSQKAQRLKPAPNEPTLEELAVASNFVEVTLAKRGHENPVGINYLYKIQWPLMPSIYGAMLAGVDALLIGAGFPKEIPNILDKLMRNDTATMPLAVTGAEGYSLQFDPKTIVSDAQLARLAFFAIVSNHLGVKAVPNADGYIIEGHSAGGHNAPARSNELDETGQPIYGPKDELDLRLLNSLLDANMRLNNGRRQPWWRASAYTERLDEAQAEGAVGVQVATPFAFCKESAIDPMLKRYVLEQIMRGAIVITDPIVSPTGFPFKVLQAEETMSSPDEYAVRQRVCDFGYLSELYETGHGIGLRCPSEPVKLYVGKGGNIDATTEKGCLCNNLLATIGVGSPGEKPIVTAGTDLSAVKELVRLHGMDYTAKNVIEYILENRGGKK